MIESKKLIDIARAAQELNKDISTEDAFNNLVEGVKRQHTAVLSNIGITIKYRKITQQVVNRYNWKHPRKKIAKWKVAKWRRFRIEKQSRFLNAVLKEGLK